LRAELRSGDIVLFKSSNGAKLGSLGDEVAFCTETFGEAQEQAPAWLSAGDFVEVTDLTGAALSTVSTGSSAAQTSTTALDRSHLHEGTH